MSDGVSLDEVERVAIMPSPGAGPAPNRGNQTLGSITKSAGYMHGGAKVRKSEQIGS